MCVRAARLPASPRRLAHRRGQTLRMTGMAAPGHRPTARTRWLADLAPADFVLFAFVALAVALGGGGTPSPLPEMLLEWAALATLAAVVSLHPEDYPWPRQATVFALALLALPALQLVPLPPAIWRGLPGREIEAAAIDLAGAGQTWMPWTVSPPRTLASLLALIVPATVVLATALASPRGRAFALVAVAAMALVSAAIGMAQLAGGAHSAWRFYASSHVEDLTGFQANRNAEADVLLTGVFALAALGFGRVLPLPRYAGIVLGCGAILLAGAVLLTASRAGIALLVASVAMAGLIAFYRFRALTSAGAKSALGGVGAAALAGLGWAIVASPVGRIGARFADGSGPRPEIWRDTLYAIGQYWPWGSGIGTFVPVFVAAERLEAVDSSFPNRAHNEFLELALEAGIPGLAVLAVLAGLLAWRWAIRLRATASPQERAELAFAAATLVALGAHSIVDYPLRSMALATLAGVAGGFILAPARHRGGAVSPGRVETKLT